MEKLSVPTVAVCYLTLSGQLHQFNEVPHLNVRLVPVAFGIGFSKDKIGFSDCLPFSEQKPLHTG
jgi:hypothetical protein